MTQKNKESSKKEEFTDNSSQNKFYKPKCLKGTPPEIFKIPLAVTNNC